MIRYFCMIRYSSGYFRFKVENNRLYITGVSDRDSNRPSGYWYLMEFKDGLRLCTSIASTVYDVQDEKLLIVGVDVV